MKLAGLLMLACWSAVLAGVLAVLAGWLVSGWLAADKINRNYCTCILLYTHQRGIEGRWLAALVLYNMHATLCYTIAQHVSL